MEAATSKEVAKDIFKACSLASGLEASAAAHGPNCVILSSLLSIGEHVKRFGNVLKPSLGSCISRMQIGVVVLGKFAVGLLQFCIRDVLGDSKDFVEVLFNPVL